MQGVITDYKESLRQRVALLRGVPVAHMEQVLRERMQYNPGAGTGCRLPQRRACHLAGIGRVHLFADHVRAGLGIQYARSNVLEVHDGHLTGRLVDQDWGDICDGQEKRRTVLELAASGRQPGADHRRGRWCQRSAHDGVAGLSVAFRAKPSVRAQARIAINSGGLDRLLEVVQP